MSLTRLQVEHFRCLTGVEIEPHPHYNLAYGKNASGKTSLLEAIFYLGRGRSFRATQPRQAVQDGEDAFQVVGHLVPDDTVIGIRGDTVGVTARIGGAPASGLSALARRLPVHLIDPGVHQLIDGGPNYRRRYLDMGVFHVEPGFHPAWQRYQRALRQRNAALRQGQPRSAIQAWNRDLAQAGEILDACRRKYLARLEPAVVGFGEALLQRDIAVGYQSGWPADLGLAEALDASMSRDEKLGATQVGPHRADLVVSAESQRARARVSRGQQKLLACALILGQASRIGEESGQAGVLLVDDAAAELDRPNVGRLLQAIADVPAQRFVTALGPDVLPAVEDGGVFHVEQATVKPVV